MDIILDYPGGPSVITWVLKMEKGKREKDGNMRSGPNIDGFEDGEMATSQGKQVVSSWKRHKNRYSSRDSRRN